MIYRELTFAERRLDYFLQAAGKEELRESDCGIEVDGSVPCARQFRSVY